jgi:hypothetical protein
MDTPRPGWGPQERIAARILPTFNGGKAAHCSPIDVAIGGIVETNPRSVAK